MSTMAQAVYLPPPSLPLIPSSPDPTPLRTIAFSVAEAALQPDPNSPSFTSSLSRFPTTDDMFASSSEDIQGWTAPWSKIERRPSLSRQRSGETIWSVVDAATERREHRKAGHAFQRSSTLPPSPPISPLSYAFVLPSGCRLAASIASTSHPSNISVSSDSRFSLFTRSAEPSPTHSTFAGLDQSRPPPEFVPRLSAQEFAKPQGPPKHTRTKSDLMQHKLPPVSPTRQTTKLPSLAQIQAKMSKGHRRGASVGSVPQIQPRKKMVMRTDSQESVEVLQTPTDEHGPTRREPRIVFSGPHDPRPPTPPSPVGKEPRLAPFLRQRTSGRLASGARSVRSIPSPEGPMLKVTPPTLESLPRFTSPVSYFQAPRTPSPTLKQFNLMVSTPPPRRPTSPLSNSPSSPTGSMRSSSTASPTLSVPIITCTPASERVLRDGIEHESDEDDVVVFDGEAESSKDREERERRGKEMKDRLLQRRRSD
ncbi:hypothetical protein BCR39DRAFT_560784 [Naematelia encephala]|uniref:Uncharacterized protein n=1 Tax=Naematelia encephala TaxID=71784 RepID=A0A1Y2ATU0_9TREE|nr:hypothetical protein BCR39DRAFT_560784 [Naematelia encephala]